VLIGIVVGLEAEARIARRLGWPVAIGGGTASGALEATRQLIDQGSDALISFGLAGGLDPALRPGELIVPSAVIVGDARYPTDPELSHMLGGATADAVLGGEAIAWSADEKRRLYDQTSAVAVDLESGAVAHSAAGRGMPFAVLRAICDPADHALPPAALTALDAHGAIAVRRIVASLMAQPGQLPSLLALAVDAAVARRSLAARVRQMRRAPA
jgi:adenosylhomocysteine nucleosidase